MTHLLTNKQMLVNRGWEPNMPFKSQAQRIYLAINKPALAKEFAKETPKGKKLPYHVGDKHGHAYSSPGMKEYVNKRKAK
jgi:hypothetical protein